MARGTRLTWRHGIDEVFAAQTFRVCNHSCIWKCAGRLQVLTIHERSQPSHARAIPGMGRSARHLINRSRTDIQKRPNADMMDSISPSCLGPDDPGCESASIPGVPPALQLLDQYQQ
jgi:hypothetical protein